jgi:hypothetical protein
MCERYHKWIFLNCEAITKGELQMGGRVISLTNSRSCSCSVAEEGFQGVGFRV